VVLASIDADRPILTEAILARAVSGRPHRPIFVIDIGVPRNAEPEIHRLDNVYLYDIDDLVSVADDNAEQRRRETVRAEAIVVEEQQRFDGWFAALRAVPTIRHLRARVEAIRSRELERALARLDLSGTEREGVESLTRSIVNKILHAPLSRLRREAQREEGMVYLEAARVLFDLDSGDDAPDGNDVPDGSTDT
jgi:glutamyl-tRNA reductase